MNNFVLIPRMPAGFVLPDALYHHAHALEKMVTEPQEPVIVGDIPDMELFTKNLNKPPDVFAQARAWTGNESFKDGIVEVTVSEWEHFYSMRAPSRYYKDRIDEVANLIDRDNRRVVVPGNFVHQAAVLQKMIDYEFALAPDLFWDKHMSVEDRTFFNLRTLMHHERGFYKFDRYTRVHYDASKLSAASDAANGTKLEVLSHHYSASNMCSTAFLRYPDKHLTGTGVIPTYEHFQKFDHGCGYMYTPEQLILPPDGKITFFNSTMLHFAALPPNRWHFRPSMRLRRSALFANFVMGRSETTEPIFARNTQLQSVAIAARQAQLAVA